MKTWFFLFGCFLPTCVPLTAVAFDEKLEVISHTLTDEEFLRGETPAGREVRLTGILSGPDGREKSAVVILMHGSDGPTNGAVWAWGRFLGSIGVATFALDSYTGRGVEQASTDQSRVLQFTQIYDAYRAVELLADHPRIDGSKIVVMGFSRGGTAALYSAMTRFKNALGPKRGRIAAHIPFYPACNFRLLKEEDVGTVPIRVFHGADDDWTPAAPCIDYIARLAEAGRDATITVLPGALHAFDNPRAPARYADAAWQTSRDCVRQEDNGQLVNQQTGKPFSYSDACVGYGPSVQYNDRAATAAQNAVKEFMSSLDAAR